MSQFTFGTFIWGHRRPTGSSFGSPTKRWRRDVKFLRFLWKFLGGFPVFFFWFFRKLMVVFFGWFYLFFLVFSPLVFLSCFWFSKVKVNHGFYGRYVDMPLQSQVWKHLGHLTFLFVGEIFMLNQSQGGVHCQVRLQFMPVLKERTSHPPWAKDAEKYEPRGR